MQRWERLVFRKALVLAKHHASVQSTVIVVLASQSSYQLFWRRLPFQFISLPVVLCDHRSQIVVLKRHNEQEIARKSLQCCRPWQQQHASLAASKLLYWTQGQFRTFRSRYVVDKEFLPKWGKRKSRWLLWLAALTLCPLYVNFCLCCDLFRNWS